MDEKKVRSAVLDLEDILRDLLPFILGDDEGSKDHHVAVIVFQMTALIAIIIIYPRPTHDFKDKKIKANLSNFYLKTKPKHIFSLYIAKSLIWR